MSGQAQAQGAVVGAEVTRRPVEVRDEAFLFAAYASSRAEELALTNWDDRQRNDFLRQQFQAQRLDYEANFPDSAHEVIELDGRAIGRIWIARSGNALHLLDIVLLEPWRGRGIGTRLMREFQAQSARQGLAARLYVWKMQPRVAAFYERLGFRVTGDVGIHWEMQWRPAAAGGTKE